MADQIKLRATLQGELTEIRILMQHPMETGQRKDPATGQLIAAHFIQSFIISANGAPLVEGQLNTSISRNPLFAFRASGLKAGNRIIASWVDSKGDQRSDETTVTAG
jgi:sulfur-oxidizing protein SoxZ